MNFGKIVQVIGPTIDVEFEDGKLPDIYNAIKVEDKEKGINLVCEVAQHLGNNIIRAVALSSTDGLKRGMPVLDTSLPITVPVVLKHKEDYLIF